MGTVAHSDLDRTCAGTKSFEKAEHCKLGSVGDIPAGEWSEPRGVWKPDTQITQDVKAWKKNSNRWRGTSYHPQMLELLLGFVR